VARVHEGWLLALGPAPSRSAQVRAYFLCRADSRLVPKARLFIAAVAIEGRNQTEVAEA